jgi:hypothetical protein
MQIEPSTRGLDEEDSMTIAPLHPSRHQRILRTRNIDGDLQLSHLSSRACEWLVVHRSDCAPDALEDRSAEDAARESPAIVVLTAGGDERDDLLRELPAHIAAVMRRRPAPERHVIDVEELHIDKNAHRVAVRGEHVSLTRVEFKLLVCLAERPERVQSRAELLAAAWGILEPIRTRTVDTHIKRVRDKLGAAGRFIRAVRGVGYRFGEPASA